MIKRLFFILTLYMALGMALRPAMAQDETTRHAHLRLLPEHSTLIPGQPVIVAIEETLDDGWHTYWINPGDSGEPPTVEWTLPPGFTAGPIEWPVPDKVVIGPLVSYGYHDHAVLLQTIMPSSTLPAGPLTLTAKIDILVCKDICIPEQGTYQLTLNDAPVDNSALIAAGRAKLPVDAGAATFAQKNDSFVLTLKNPPDLAPGTAVDLMPIDWGVVDNAASASLNPQDANITIQQKSGERPLKDLQTIKLVLGWDGKDGLRHGVFIQAKPAPATIVATPDKISLLKAIILAILGGLILNLMPCVFPILSLKTLKLCTLSGKDLQEARRHSLFDMLGILVSFAVLATFLIILRGAGQQIGWGFQLQNPSFVLPLAWLLFVIGLNLSGFFEFGASFVSYSGNWSWLRGHADVAAFFTGVLAAVVATPCTAPFMGVAIGYALTQPPVITVAVMLALGFGLGLPFLLISFMPSWRSALPKPGAWMVTFRELLAFPLYASAAWLVWVFSMQTGPSGLPIALTGLVGIVFALWLLKKSQSETLIPSWLLQELVAVVLIGVAALIPLTGKLQVRHVTLSATGDWAPYSTVAFDALEKGDAPLFVDMTAAWCITCKINEGAVLDTAAMTEFFHAHQIQTIRGDWTNQNPEITNFLARHGRNGVPLYVFYGARDSATKQRPVPVVLPQLLTAGTVEKVVGK